MKTLIALLFLSFAVSAQVSHSYAATTGDVVLNSAATALTIQQPATNGKQVAFAAATVYCSVACVISQAQNGTAATATAGTVNRLLPFGPAAVATVWTASNVGAGTAAAGAYRLAAGQTVTFDLTALSMGNTGNATNYTVSIASMSGTANITVQWSER